MLPTMEEMAKNVNLAIKTLKDGTLPDVPDTPTESVSRLTDDSSQDSEVNQDASS